MLPRSDRPRHQPLTTPKAGTLCRTTLAAGDMIDRRYTARAVTAAASGRAAALDAERWLSQPHCPVLDSIARKGKIPS
jgi:thioredoxin reductase